MNRRTFLFASSATLLASTSLAGCQVPESRPKPATVSTDFAPDVELSLTAMVDTIALLAGEPTEVWRYRGEVLRGDPSALQEMAGTYLGPTIHVRTGQKVRIHFHNELPEESIIHWHGLILPDDMDGHPRYVIEPGETYVYEFKVQNRAGTYWYHPHPHGRTGIQVYKGLAGLFIVEDEAEAALDLPTGAYDIPLVLQDRTFYRGNELYYPADTSADGMMGDMMEMAQHEQMMGMIGDTILVNGRPDFSLNVERRGYRLRILNGANARIFTLGWDDGTPLTIIGTDGGLIDAPIERPYLHLAPAERIELWVDFSQWAVGDEPTLMNLPPINTSIAFPVLQTKVIAEAITTPTLPKQLVPIERYAADDAANRTDPRVIQATIEHMQWTLNGREFEMEKVANDERVSLGKTEIWVFDNGVSGGGMMGGMMGGMELPHPMHIHGVQFQILSRAQTDPPDNWQQIHAGFVDEGWQDTVLVMPGERVEVIMRYTQPGLFLYHCHNLEHEDMGMMRNFEVS